MSYGRFWNAQFTGVQGWGAAEVTLIGGKALGGDSGFLYTGTYTQQGDNLAARIHVSPFVAGAVNVMGQNEFDLELTGTLQGNTVAVVGGISGTPLRLNGSRLLNPEF